MEALAAAKFFHPIPRRRLKSFFDDSDALGQTDNASTSIKSDFFAIKQEDESNDSCNDGCDSSMQVIEHD